MQIEMKEQIEEKVNSTLRLEKLEKKAHEKATEYHKQRDTKLLLDGLDIELTSHGTRRALELKAMQKDLFDLAEESKWRVAGTQTLLKTIGRDVEVVVTSSREMRKMKEIRGRVDGEAQTDLTYNVLEFMAEGSQRYERVIKFGLIKESELHKVNLDSQECEQYYMKLIEQEL